MKIQSLKTKLIGPALLLIPMACMQLGDDHPSGPPSGHRHFSIYQPSYQYSIHAPGVGSTIESPAAIQYDSKRAQETTTHAEGGKGGN